MYFNLYHSLECFLIDVSDQISKTLFYFKFKSYSLSYNKHLFGNCILCFDLKIKLLPCPTLQDSFGPFCVFIISYGCFKYLKVISLTVVLSKTIRFGVEINVGAYNIDLCCLRIYRENNILPKCIFTRTNNSFDLTTSLLDEIMFN